MTFTITGTNQTTTIIDGGALDRVLHIHSGKTVEITSVTVRNGDVPVIDPSDSGGGIYNDGGTLTLVSSTITSNTAAFSGGIASSGTAELTSSTVSNNTAQRPGGIGSSGILTLTNSTVSNNTAWNGAGGGIQNSGTLTINNSTVSGNEATAAFGDGGGIDNSGTLTITSSNITGNTATRLAGGIINNDTLTLTNSTVSNNTASSSDAGGIRNGDSAQISNSIINGNSAGGSAGGIQNFGGATLTNVTISGNSATSNGGGLGNWLATITLTNVTINANSASGTGGGIYVASGTVKLKNTIVANSVSGGDFGGAEVTSLGHNLDSDGTGALGGTGDLSNTDPLLGPLQDNGGLTFTHALLTGSPAIDAGDNTGCPATDQRGIARPLDSDGDSTATADMGAYELDINPPTMEAIGEAQGQYYNTAPSFSNFGFDDDGALDDGWYQVDSFAGTWTALFTDATGSSWDSDGWTRPILHRCYPTY
ncbi:hypothetical protein ES703_67220 [subsurface metagenome]